jgi:hypothetical protein
MVADRGRSRYTPIVEYTPVGIILDVAIDTLVSTSYPFTWGLSPMVVGANLEDVPSAAISCRITNLDSVSRDTSVTFSYLQGE